MQALESDLSGLLLETEERLLTVATLIRRRRQARPFDTLFPSQLSSLILRGSPVFLWGDLDVLVFVNVTAVVEAIRGFWMEVEYADHMSPVQNDLLATSII